MTATVVPVFASPVIKPTSREQDRLAALRVQAEAKSGAHAAVRDAWQEEVDAAQAIERFLPVDSEYLRCTVAELEKVVPDRGRVHELNEARRAAQHRDRAASYQPQISRLGAEAAALNTLVRNCERHLESKAAQ